MADSRVIDDASVLSTKAADTILSIQMSLAAYAQNAAFTSDDQCMDTMNAMAYVDLVNNEYLYI